MASIYFEIQHFGDCEPLQWLLHTLNHPDHSLNVSYDGPETARHAMASEITPSLDVNIRTSSEARWCGPSLMRQTLAAMRRALESDSWDYYVNLSGVCAPLQPLAKLHDWINLHHARGIRAHAFTFKVNRLPEVFEALANDPIDHRTVGRFNLRGPHGFLNRFGDDSYFPLINPQNRLYLHCSEPPEDRRLLAVRPLSADEIHFRQRFLEHHPHYCGRAWYALHRSACEAILAYLESVKSADLREIFMSMLIPEESLLQTILANGLAMDRDLVLPANLHLNQGAPQPFDNTHKEALLADESAFFVRKVIPGAASLRAELRAKVNG